MAAVLTWEERRLREEAFQLEASPAKKRRLGERFLRDNGGLQLDRPILDKADEFVRLGEISLAQVMQLWEEAKANIQSLSTYNLQGVMIEIEIRTFGHLQGHLKFTNEAAKFVKECLQMSAEQMRSAQAVQPPKVVVAPPKVAKKVSSDGQVHEFKTEAAAKAYEELHVALQETIRFAANSFTLADSADQIIDKVADVLKRNPTMKICVEGHTGCKCLNDCRSGSLSMKRSNAVSEALKEKGCTNEMTAAGHGCKFKIGMAVNIFPASGQ